MTRKDLKQIYDMMDKLDGIKNDQELSIKLRLRAINLS